MKRADVSVTLRSKPGAAERANELGCDEWVGGSRTVRDCPAGLPEWSQIGAHLVPGKLRQDLLTLPSLLKYVCVCVCVF